MEIQWFPGHMFRAKKSISARLPAIDLVIQVLDARIPGSSLNPLMSELARDKQKLYLLNKADLADPEVTRLWLSALKKENKTEALATRANNGRKNNQLLKLCRRLAPTRGGLIKPLRILIGGIPNVGKSTLINNLASRKIAATGNIAGVTKTEQRIVLEEDIWLYDTPGLLWEKIAVPESGYRLAALGSVGRNAYADVDVARAILTYLLERYPEALSARYNIKMEGVHPSLTPDSTLELIARARGSVGRGGEVNRQKTAELLLQDLRSGRLGAISLERPEEYQNWVKEAAARDATREKEIAAAKLKKVTHKITKK